MRPVLGLLCLLLASVSGCSQAPTVSATTPDLEDSITAWPKDWSGHVGQRVRLEGTAANTRLGALLQGEGGAIWIDGLDSWPEGFYSGGDRGKRLRVCGTVITKDDLPVFVQKPGDVPRAGIPVQSEEESEKAKRRYLLKDAKWTVLE
jgi:hypothetical protein